MRSILLLGSCLALVIADDLKYSQIVDKDGKVTVQWQYDNEAEILTICATYQTTGWVGCGFSPNGGMPGADIFIAGVHPNGTSYFGDYHAVSFSKPLKDQVQNYKLISVTESKTTTKVCASRAYHTCDENDLDITTDTITVIFAFGESDLLSYHKTNRYQSNMILLSDYQYDNYPDPTISDSFDVLMPNYEIPAVQTKYACYFNCPVVLGQKHHIYQIDPIIQSGNENMVHHILVHSCPNSTKITHEVGTCYNSTDPADLYLQCSMTIAGWAVGGTSMRMPPEAGLSIGGPDDPQCYKIEVHYNNMQKLSGIKDSSGIRFHYTPNLRQYDAGVLQTGVFLFHLDMVIPPGAQAYETHAVCKTERFGELCPNSTGDVKIFSVLLHTHLKGKSIEAALIRDGKQIASLGRDMKYDFNLQQWRSLNVTSKLGDEYQMKCTYNTIGETKTVPGGLSTQEEMCLAFYYMYPRQCITACSSEANHTYVAQELGVDPSMPLAISLANYTWNDEKIAIAQEATKNSAQTLIIEKEMGIKVFDTAFNHEITPPEKGSCNAATYPDSA